MAAVPLRDQVFNNCEDPITEDGLPPRLKVRPLDWPFRLGLVWHDLRQHTVSLTQLHRLAGFEPGLELAGIAKFAKVYARHDSIVTQNVSQTSEPRAWRLLADGGVDDRSYLGDAIGREAALLGMGANGGLVRRDVDAVDLVVGDVAVQPLDLGAQLTQHSARRLRDGLQLGGRKLARIGDFALDHVLWH